MGDIEHAECDMCKKEAPVQRKYYRYPIKCTCCNGKRDNHFEIVRYCEDCTPQPPKIVKVHIEPSETEELPVEDKVKALFELVELEPNDTHTTIITNILNKDVDKIDKVCLVYDWLDDFSVDVTGYMEDGSIYRIIYPIK